jgi:poly-beta-1,6-N-acetyl-D-glucosamine synthase
MLILIFFLIFLFLIIFISLFASFYRRFKQPLPFTGHFYSFSIVVAIKNEEKNIGSLINYLKKLEYPADKYEIIIVDDKSMDNSHRLVSQLSEGFPNFKIISSEGKTLPAKKGALQKGIEFSRNEFILITDADCFPPPDWISVYNKRFSLGYDFLFGLAPLIESKFLLPLYDNLRSTFLTFSAAELGIPYSAAARNFGFRKSAFYEVNQYGNTTQTLSGDDDLLLREAYKTNLKIGTVTEVSVPTFPPENMKQFKTQKTRHTKTSLYYLPLQQLFLTVWHLLNLLFLFSPLLIILSPCFPLLFIVKLIADGIILITTEKKLKYSFSLISALRLNFQYEIMIIINIINALTKKEVWK